MSAVTKRQISLLAPYLEGESPTHRNQDGTREWNLICPIHADAKRSASLNVDKGVFYCFRCGGMPITALIRQKSDWHDPGQHKNGSKPNLDGQPADKQRRHLSKAMVDGWHSALMSNDGRLTWLNERRAISDDTIKQYQIGLEENHYTIPIYDEHGDLVNVRYYNPNPSAGRRKIWGETGYNSPPRLYPLSLMMGDPSEVIILAGEWDTLLALQHGYPAITRTAGENTWHNEWGIWFKDRKVYICQDADAEGEGANKMIAGKLWAVTNDILLVPLPYPTVEKHGQDVTDLFMDFGPDKLRELMADATPYRKAGKHVSTEKTKELETVTVLDTFDAARTGEPMRVVVTIKGRKEPGYTIPKRIVLACSQDAGNKCQGCPLNANNGDAVIDVAQDDPITLAFIDSTSQQMAGVVAEAYGVPGGRCGRLTQVYEEYQAVEVLFARPALDYSDGSDSTPDAAMYKSMKITSVGRHDTIANNTVAVVGALHPSPRDQKNEFLAHELEYLETAVDRFDMTVDTIAMMKVFQPSSKQSPLKKMAEISKNLSEHVTRIHGRPQMHVLMDVVFHSCLQFKFAGEMVNRGWLEALIVGDTRTGKSLAAERLVRHFGGGELISCEAASFAGVVGGLQQMGGKDWAITWGVVPINDKRLVVLDEISGLTPEEIAQMSDIRSSGQAKLIKIQQETTWARTRLLWLGNPRNATMANYTYGVDAIKPLIGNAEDIARFDLAMAASLYDVPAETINQRVEGGELLYTHEACHAMLMWCWTRTADQISFTREAESKVFDLANEMGKQYIEDPPLVQAANIRIKIARLAVAIAARTFSTDASHQKVIVKPSHVEDAARFMNVLYGMPTFGYRDRSKEVLADRYAAEQKKGDIEQYLKGRPMLAKHLRNQGKFRRQDLEELLNISREEANAIINTLYEARMVRRVLGDIVVEPTLHALLREVKLT